jgi:hypothetical protein
MGADMADINNDGKADVLLLICFQNKMKAKNTTSFESYDLFLRKINLDF